MLQELFNKCIEGVKIIVSFIPFVIGFILIHIMLFVAFDLLTSVMFGDMMFAKTFLPEETYKKLYDYLNRE